MIHGKRGSYVQGCRCKACSQANLDYWHRREKDKAKEEWGAKKTYWMDARPVRKHVERLLRLGATKRGICANGGVPRTTMHNLMNYKPSTGKPIKRIRREMGERILGLQLCDVTGKRPTAQAEPYYMAQRRAAAEVDARNAARAL